jgi:NTE family protein
MASTKRSSLSTQDFTGEAQVYNLIDELKETHGKKEYSDIIDDEGHQYVDLVMEGGGVLGIALVGYTYVLEQVGIRFLGVGGTSAGAINAALLAGLGKPEQAKSEEILSHLASVDMGSFVDGDDDAKDFIQSLLREPEEQNILQKSLPGPYLLMKGGQVLDNLNNDLGLNPGKTFYKWIRSILDKDGVTSTAELRQRMAPPKNLKARHPRKLRAGATDTRLALIAADITTETKAEFPKMAGLYWKDENEVHPAHYVRASMSVPGFFHPYKVKGIPQGDDARKRWSEHAQYKGNLPEECLFIDGGIMSNFPINLFHKPEFVPLAPTFGARLGTDRLDPRKIDSPFQMLGAIFDAARHTLDLDFISKNPDYKKLVTDIDPGDHHWLNFELSDEAKKDLFIRGARAAYHFLIGFDWKSYKKLRKEIAKVCEAEEQISKSSNPTS